MKNDMRKVMNALKLLILIERVRVKTATGLTRADFKYARAEAVRPDSIETMAYVTFEGKEYGPCYITNGSLEDDVDTSTVLIETDEGIFWKLWFYNSELEKPSSP